MGINQGVLGHVTWRFTEGTALIAGQATRSPRTETLLMSHRESRRKLLAVTSLTLSAQRSAYRSVCERHHAGRTTPERVRIREIENYRRQIHTNPRNDLHRVVTLIGYATRSARDPRLPSSSSRSLSTVLAASRSIRAPAQHNVATPKIKIATSTVSTG